MLNFLLELFQHSPALKLLMRVASSGKLSLKVYVGGFAACSTPPQFSSTYFIISLAFTLGDTVQLQAHSSEIEVAS